VALLVLVGLVVVVDVGGVGGLARSFAVGVAGVRDWGPELGGAPGCSMMAGDWVAFACRAGVAFACRFGVAFACRVGVAFACRVGVAFACVAGTQAGTRVAGPFGSSYDAAVGRCWHGAGQGSYCRNLLLPPGWEI
jgi:hypothetical protein